MISILRHLRIAVLAGWSGGLLWGLFDAVMRVWVQRFEWYELYLALLLPALVLALLFGCIALILHCASLILSFPVREDITKLLYPLLLFTFYMLLGAGVIITASLRSGEGGVVGEVLAVVIVLAAVTVFAVKVLLSGKIFFRSPWLKKYL